MVMPLNQMGNNAINIVCEMASLIQTLQENLTRYERAFGPVQRRG